MGLIRLLLALSVVVTHSAASGGADAHGRIFGLELVGGQAAVQAFYVISGFYMALVLVRKYPRGAAGYRTFLSARILRLFPAYLFVLGLTILLAITRIVPHPALDRWRAELPKMNASTIALYAGAQLTLIGQDAVWFTDYDTSTGVGHFSAHPDISLHAAAATSEPLRVIPGMSFLFVGQAWTLGVELLFYCLAPLIVRRVGTIVPIFALSWIIRLTLAHFGLRDDPWSYRFFPSELAMFLMGSLGYHVYASLDAARLKSIGRVAWPAMVLLILFLFEFRLPLRALMVACAMAACVPFVFALTKDWKFDRWIGELSYPVYVTHETVRLALDHYSGHANVYALVIATLVASILLMLGVEQPFERMRARFVARRRTLITAQSPATATPSGQAGSSGATTTRE